LINPVLKVSNLANFSTKNGQDDDDKVEDVPRLLEVVLP
jgi:hypothetical protein